MCLPRFTQDQGLEPLADTPPPAAPDDAGLEVVGWKWHSREYRTVKLTTWHPDTQADTAEPLVTLASAQAALEAERAKVVELEAANGRLANLGRIIERERDEALERIETAGARAERLEGALNTAAGCFDDLAAGAEVVGKAAMATSARLFAQLARQALASQPQAGVGS